MNLRPAGYELGKQIYIDAVYMEKNSVFTGVFGIFDFGSVRVSLGEFVGW